MGTLRLRARLSDWLGDPLSAIALLLVAAWTPAAIAAALGRAPVPLIALLALPALMVTLLASRRKVAPPALRASVGWTAILGGAILCTLILEAAPTALLVAPALLLSAVACSHYPATSVLVIFILTGSFGSLTAFTPLPVAETIDVILAGLWLGALWGYLFGADRRPIWLWPGVVAITIYIALTAFEVLAADNRETAFFSFRASAWYLAAVLLVALAPWREGARMRIARGVVLTALLVGAYAAVRFVIGPSASEEELALSRTDNPDFAEFVGSFTGKKELAAWSAEVIPFCVAFALVFRGRWRLAATAASALLAFALVGTDARIAVVAVAGGVAVVLGLHQFARGLEGLRLGGTATAIATVLLVGLTAFGLATGFSEESTERYASIFEPGEEETVQARVHTWETVLNDIDEQPFGQGLGTTTDIHQRFGRFVTVGGRSLDNGYLKVGLEQGLAVMVFFILSMIALLYGLGRRTLFTLHPARAALAIGATGTLASTLILNIAGTFNDGFTALAAWVIVGIGVAQLAWREEGVTALGSRSSGDDASVPHSEGKRGSSAWLARASLVTKRSSPPVRLAIEERNMREDHFLPAAVGRGLERTRVFPIRHVGRRFPSWLL